MSKTSYCYKMREYLPGKSIIVAGCVAAFVAIVAPASAQTTNWNAYSDFYLTPTADGWGGATNPSAAGAAWGYYAANVNGSGFPTQIGAYFTPQFSGSGSQSLYQYSSVAPLGSGALVGASGWSATGGAGFPNYADTYGWGSSLGRYDTPWFDGAPQATNRIWMQAGWLSGTSAEGIAPVLSWKAPTSAQYTFSGSWVIGNNGEGSDASFAIVDSLGTPLSPRTAPAMGSTNPFTFTKYYTAGSVVQFQVGTDYKTGAAVGLDANVVLASTNRTTWNAFDDFYVNVPASGGAGSFPQTGWISLAGQIPYDSGFTNSNAWGYAGGNFNANGNPSSVGTYVSEAAGNLYPLTTGGQFAGPGASYLLGGTDFFIGYNDNYSLADTNLPSGQTQIAKYTKEWFSGTPNYANAPDATNNKYLWLQATGLSSSTDGLGAVLTWTAPYAGTFVFSGSYVNGNYGQSTAFAVVDSSNRVLLPKVSLQPSSSVSNFNFTNTMVAGDVVQFQAATPAEAQGSPLGLAVSVQLATTQSPYNGWATGYGLDPAVTSGPTAGAPTADPDKDGFSNSNEYAFGTNPTVPNGSLLSTSVSSGKMTVSWSGPAAGVSYVVQTTTNLVTTPFQAPTPAIDIDATGGIMSFTNQATGNKFFRVQATITNN